MKNVYLRGLGETQPPLNDVASYRWWTESGFYEEVGSGSWKQSCLPHYSGGGPVPSYALVPTLHCLFRDISAAFFTFLSSMHEQSA